MSDKTILVVGTYDTKNDELEYMVERVRALGGGTLSMDISVLGDPEKPTDFSKHDVAEAGGSSIKAAIDSGDENTAMQIMAKGASTLARQLFAEGKFDGVVVLGGTMGTDAAGHLPSAAPRRAEIRGLDRVLFAVDRAAAVVGGYPDDPLGGRALRAELGLQVVAQPSGRRGFGRGSGG